jgi:chromosome segregation ATPase
MFKTAPRNEKPPARSAVREALAAAIERHERAKRELAATEEALDTCRGTARDAESALERAAAAIEEAKANAARHLTDTALGRAGEAPVSIRQARANYQNAQDDYDSAIAAKGALAAKLKEAESELYWAQTKLNEGVAAAVKTDPAIRKLVVDGMAAHQELANHFAASAWLSSKGLIPDDLKDWHKRPPAINPDTSALEAFVNALAGDADASLPEGIR